MALLTPLLDLDTNQKAGKNVINFDDAFGLITHQIAEQDT